MKITKISQITGIEHTFDIPVTQEQLDLWENGMLIQRAMPNLSDWEREFLISGSTQEEWDEIFPEDEDYGDFDTEIAF